MFWVSRNHIQWVLSPKIFTNAKVRPGGGLTPPPYGQPDRKISVVFFDGFPKLTTEIIMIWNVCQIRRQRWIAKAKSVGICTVVKASLRDQRLAIPNFTILGHSPTHHTSFELIDEEFLGTLFTQFELRSKPVFSQTDRWQNNHGLLTSKRCAKAPLVILLQIWETREKREAIQLIP